MNAEVWKKIELFDLDEQKGEYDFSTRLASENEWSKNFTSKAILEYKKFMYLAATQQKMVSPSEIVDIVWHQHLLFSHSYQKFCEILGKQIQHIPSTHHKKEFSKFKAAKDDTEKTYHDNFGELPADIWKQNSMYGSLNLKNSNMNFSLLNFLLLFCCGLLYPFFSIILKPLYLKFGNPYFVISYVLASVAIFIALKFFTDLYLKKTVKKASPESYIFNLEPYELIYFKQQNTNRIINGSISELIDNKSISVSKNGDISLEKDYFARTKEQQIIIDYLEEYGSSKFIRVQKNNRQKPIFKNTENIAKKTLQKFRNSVEFQRIFCLNVLISGVLVNLGIVRIVLGILRDKPIFQISFVTVFLTLFLLIYLRNLSFKPITFSIPRIYTKEILPKKHADLDWQWSYFLGGSTVLATSIIPFVNRPSTSDNFVSSCGTSSDSSCGGNSCGSGCGSSCGGCGGS